MGSISRSTLRPIVVLPEPDSPASPRTSFVLYVETHVVDGFHMPDDAWNDAAADLVPLAQVLHLENGDGVMALELASSFHRTQRTM